jgi:hypothetical protein
LLLESALLPDSGSRILQWGVEFEEDSGDFPTTKLPFHGYWGISPRLTLGVGAELVVFNLRKETSLAPVNSSVSLLYQLRGSEQGPTLTVRQDLLAPTGGLGTGRWNGTSTLLATWRRSDWLIHANAAYTIGGHDDKPLQVSETDRWRALWGVEYAPSGKPWTLLAGFVAAKPLRPKKFEPSLEAGICRSWGGGWSAQLGAGKRVRAHHGPEYLLRATVAKRL